MDITKNITQININTNDIVDNNGVDLSDNVNENINDDVDLSDNVDVDGNNDVDEKISDNKKLNIHFHSHDFLFASGKSKSLLKKRLQSEEFYLYKKEFIDDIVEYKDLIFDSFHKLIKNTHITHFTHLPDVSRNDTDLDDIFSNKSIIKHFECLCKELIAFHKFNRANKINTDSTRENNDTK